MSFTQRRLKVSITLAQDTQTAQPAVFAESQTDQVTTPSNLRMTARVQNSGAPSNSTATISVFGLSQSLQDQLSTLGMRLNLIPKNTLILSAGDVNGNFVPVFGGTIQQAYADLNAMPNVPFIFECQSGLADAVTLVPPSSYAGNTDVASIAASMARLMNLNFENNGITTQLRNPYFSGSIVQQVRDLREAANCNVEIVDGGATLAIWPLFGSRGNKTIPLIAPPPDGEMITAPSYTQNGIMVRNVFNPLVLFGGKVLVQSRMKRASGTWVVHKLDHALDSIVENGEWSSTLYCYSDDQSSPVIPPGS